MDCTDNDQNKYLLLVSTLIIFVGGFDDDKGIGCIDVDMPATFPTTRKKDINIILLVTQTHAHIIFMGKVISEISTYHPVV